MNAKEWLLLVPLCWWGGIELNTLAWEENSGGETGLVSATQGVTSPHSK